MGSTRRAASARRRRAGLRLVKLPPLPSSPSSSRLEDSSCASAPSPTAKRRRRRGEDAEPVAELRPAFAYRELPREVLAGADVDLSTWSVVATDTCIARLAARDNAPSQGSSNQLVDTVRALSAASPTRPAVLVHLNLTGASQLTDRAAMAIGDAFPSLRRLHLSGAHKLTDASVLHVVSRCRDLRMLFLAGLPLLGSAALLAASALRLPLRELDLAGCVRVSEAALVSIARGCPALELLDCSGCPGASDALLDELARGCRALRSLRVAHCPQLADAGLLALANGAVGGLQELDLARRDLAYKVSDTSLLALGAAFAALRSVTLAGCAALTDVGVSWLVERCRGLARLDLSRCVKLSDLALRAVGDNLPLLERLGVSACPRISARGLRHLARGCPRLAELDASRLPLLRDDASSWPADAADQAEGVAAVAACCPGLKRVDLTDCALVGDRALVALATANGLRELRVGGCARLVTSAGVRAVLAACHQLEALALDGCVLVDDAAFASLDASSSLLSLRLGGCSRVSDAALAALGRCAPQLRALDLSGCLRVSDAGLLALLSPSAATEGDRRRSPRPSTLQRLWLRGLPLVSAAAVAWLAAFAPRLLLLDVTACAAVPDASLAAVASGWKFARLVLPGDGGAAFRGVLPIERAADRLVLEDYGDCWRAATRIQALFRARQARRLAAQLREEALARWVALRLQSAFRGRQARKLAALRRLQRRKETDAAVALQTRFRARREARFAAEQLRLRLAKTREDAARAVQLAFRLSKLRRKLASARARLAAVRERRTRAAVLIQRVWRGHFARAVRVARLRADRTARVAREYKAVVTLQCRVRSRLARRRAAERQEQRRRLCELEERAASSLQRVWRGRQARREVLELRGTLRRLHAAAKRLQRWWRASRRRSMDAAVAAARQARTEHEAAARLQAAWKRRQGALEVRLLRLAREDAARRAHEAAGRVQRRWRARKQEAEARRERASLLERIVREAQRLHVAVAKVQARVRGRRARREVAALRLARKKARWKLVEQRDGVDRFYYNTETGEVRLRRPQDVLDLLPTPACGNCDPTPETPATDAAVECDDCGEAFCAPCWERVHAGGRRRLHAFRWLRDADGRRVDYGEAEFPSRWPPELHQDDRDGWTLRTAPFRVPEQVVGAWERYVDAASGRAWFFNSLTGEDAYEPPAGVSFSVGHAQGDADAWGRYEQETETGAVEYFYNHRTGESTYERPAEWLGEPTGAYAGY